MPSKDTFTIAPNAAANLMALTSLIGPEASVGAGFAFKKSATTAQSSAKEVAPTVAPSNV